MVELLRDELRRLGDRIDQVMSRHVSIDRYDAEMAELRRDVADLTAARQREAESRERLRLLMIGSIACPILVAVIIAVVLAGGAPS